ncbi:hypothetical protein Q9L58_010594 [Maublancomyces gigas]|uniref:Uncharacterized protein n=1 Tax=Discina gigas TaxID=1032678 RepID=A0ABR3G3P6_9PEZI
MSASTPSAPGGTTATANLNTCDPEPTEELSKEPLVSVDVPTREPDMNEEMEEPVEEGSTEAFSADFTIDFYPLVDYAQGADRTVQYMVWGIRNALSPISA